MPRKRGKTEKEKKLMQEIQEEELAELEEELAPEELESLEGEYEEEALEDLDEEGIESIAAAEEPEKPEEETPEPAEEAGEPIAASVQADIRAAEEEMEPFEEYEEEEEEEVEEIPEAPIRRETRQELLGRLMGQLLDDREQVHLALERVRDLNTQLRDAGGRPPETLKEQYHKAIADLSRARREENFARSELMQVLSWRG